MAKPTIDRRDVLKTLFPKPEEYLFVSGLAGSAKDAAKLTDDGDNLFTMAGTMGAAVPMALGVALAAPERKVAAITGDGELLMMVSMRGDYGEQNPWQYPMGQAVEPLLHAMGVLTFRVERPDELGPATAAAINAAYAGGHGAALILSQKFLGAKPFPRKEAN